MRFTMISIGSTGDVRPYIILGQELKKRGHEITIAAFDMFEDLVKDAGLKYYPITGDVTRLMSKIMKPGVNGFTYLQQLESALKEIAPMLVRDLQNACQDAQGIISTFFGSVAYSIAEKNNIPCIQTQFFPMDYNTSVPISSAPGLRLGKTWNKTSYKLGYLLINTLEKRYLTGWRKEQGMRKRKIKPKPDYVINGHTIPVIYAMSPLLLPRPLAWNEHIHMSGFWTPPEKDTFEPSDELKAFLATGEKPVYIGFGSMVSGDMGKTLDIVLNAVKQAGVRVIISKGWGGGAFQAPENVFVADYIPHDWLFEQVAAVVHHGGAGTTSAGLRAGKPTLIIPFGGDQPFWSLRVRAMGCGPKPIRRESLTSEKLAYALRDLVDTKSYQVAASELGIRLCQENGTRNAADIVEQEMELWLRHPIK